MPDGTSPRKENAPHLDSAPLGRRRRPHRRGLIGRSAIASRSFAALDDWALRSLIYECGMLRCVGEVCGFLRNGGSVQRDRSSFQQSSPAGAATFRMRQALCNVGPQSRE